jgi:4a-hydroxytetrahydrobiopterin dehydratase
MNLKDKTCVPCKEGTPPLDDLAVASLLGQIHGWTADDSAPGRERQLHKRFRFANFVDAMAFLNRVATVAEAEQHHPDFSVHYNIVDVTLWTHSVGGLSENDFILAARLDAVAV